MIVKHGLDSQTLLVFLKGKGIKYNKQREAEIDGLIETYVHDLRLAAVEHLAAQYNLPGGKPTPCWLNEAIGCEGTRVKPSIGLPYCTIGGPSHYLVSVFPIEDPVIALRLMKNLREQYDARIAEEILRYQQMRGFNPENIPGGDTL